MADPLRDKWPTDHRAGLKVIALGTLLVVSGLFCVLAIWRGWLKPDTIHELVARAGSWGMVAYVVGVLVMELLWLPRMWGLLAGGILFGPLVGGLLSVIADLSGGLSCYLLARFTGQDWVAQLLARRPRAQQIVDLLAHRRGATTLAFLRICPVAHYTLVSYAAGLTGVSFSSFLLGTGVGIVPGAILYPLVGDAALQPGSPIFFISVGLVVVALVITIYWARRVLKTEDMHFDPPEGV